MVVYVSLVNQRHFYFVILTNFVFLRGAFYSFRIKYGIITLKRYVKFMGEGTLFVMKNLISTGEVGKKNTHTHYFKCYKITEWFHTFEKQRLNFVPFFCHMTHNYERQCAVC